MKTVCLLVSTTTLTTTSSSPHNGCDFASSAPMFNQQEDVSAPITKWSFRIRYTRIVKNTINWPTYKHLGKGHISTLQVTHSFNMWDKDGMYPL